MHLRPTRKEKDYNPCLTVLAEVFNKYVNQEVSYSILRDEFHYLLGNKEERFDVWFDKAFRLKAFDPVIRNYRQRVSEIYCTVYVTGEVRYYG